MKSPLALAAGRLQAAGLPAKTGGNHIVGGASVSFDGGIEVFADSFLISKMGDGWVSTVSGPGQRTTEVYRGSFLDLAVDAVISHHRKNAPTRTIDVSDTENEDWLRTVRKGRAAQGKATVAKESATTTPPDRAGRRRKAEK